MMPERDPEPTDPMGIRPPRECPIQACPCRALERSAAAWGNAALAVEKMDKRGAVIDFVVPGASRRLGPA